MYSILYVADGTLFQLGPTDTEEGAMELANDAQVSGEFDVLDQHVYLIYPDHRLAELAGSDLDD